MIPIHILKKVASTKSRQVQALINNKNDNKEQGWIETGKVEVEVPELIDTTEIKEGVASC